MSSSWLALVAADIVSLAAGHGAMFSPRTRNQNGHLWFNQGCQIGCAECEGWGYYQFACATMEPTLDPSLRTYSNVNSGGKTPWRAPGFAPVLSPCGLAAGWYEEYAPGGGDAPPGYAPGFDGRDLPKLGGQTTEWPVGSTQEVLWQFYANHGGGYAYRLCPSSGSMSEECFQSHHLAFVGETSWIQYGWNGSNRTAIQAHRTSTGTHPEGSQWTKVPIPPCSGPGGGYDGTGCDSPQFPSPIPGLWGHGPRNGCAYNPMPPAERAEYCGEMMDFRIVDMVKIPESLPLGEYVLSFRWDCEESSQIWTQCADVKITASESPPPSPTPPTQAPTTPAPAPPTTAPAPGCSDTNQYCEDWAANGECEINPGFMLDSCPASCGICSSPRPCTDDGQYCEDWAASGECDTNPNYMLESCRKSCGVCSLSAAARREARGSLKIARKLV